MVKKKIKSEVKEKLSLEDEIPKAEEMYLIKDPEDADRALEALGVKVVLKAGSAEKVKVPEELAKALGEKYPYLEFEKA